MYEYPFQTLMYSTFDFVDLEEDPSTKTNFVDSSNFPQISHAPPTMLVEKPLFIRSNCSPIKSQPVAFVVEIPQLGTLRFNPKGPKHEGRDSQVFRGELSMFLDSEIIIQVAVKVYIEKNSPSALKEIQIAQSLTQNRPDFLKLYYSGTINGAFTSLWEWIDGGSLDKMICKAGPGFMAYSIKSISRSLAHLHANNIAHHDLKPQNFLVTSDFTRVILIDFGDSKHLVDEMISIEEGIGLGTLAYTAPELLCRKTDLYNPLSADIYSFGVLLFFIINHGKILPFGSLLPHRAVQMILNVQKGFFASGYNPQSPVDDPLFPIITACLQIDPKSRPKFPFLLDQITDKLE